MKNLRKRLLAGLCALLIVPGSVTLGPVSDILLTPITASAAAAPSSAKNGFVTTEGGLTSTNSYYYGNWASTVNSYLYENSDGTLYRVEYSGGKVCVEKYKKDGTLVSTKTIEPELPMFGGFYSGTSYNFLVFGQSNSGDSDDVEVFRVVKYDKNWNRISSVSMKGIDSYCMFEAGSLRMAEAGGKLFIHTCTTMYDHGDGLHHQARKKFIVDIAAMTCTVDNTGYSSHSFNQFVITDGTTVYFVDHGDAYDRAVQITKHNVSDTGGTKKVNAMTFGGATGNNFTGCKVGGFEYGTGSLLVCGSSIDQSLWSNGSNSDRQYNVFVIVSDKSDLSVKKTVWLTDYQDTVSSGTSAVSVSAARMVKASDSRFIVMWTEGSGSSIKTKFQLIDNNGNKVYDPVEYDGDIISDCPPILCSDGLVRWYKTNSSTPRIYTLDPSSPGVNYKSISSASVTFPKTVYNYGKEVTPDPVVVYNGSRLSKGVDYTVEYSDNINAADDSKAVIKGMGTFTGSKTVSFDIEPMDINDVPNVTVANSSYTGSAVIPSVTLRSNGAYEYDPSSGYYYYRSTTLVKDTDYTVTGKNNINASESAVVIITGKGNYTGTLEKTFTISPRSISYTSVSANPSTVTYDGTAQTPAIVVKDSAYDTVLTQGKDFDAVITNNINKGYATVEVTGKGNYTGTKTSSYAFYINGKSLMDEDIEVTLDCERFEYDGTAKEPAVTVKWGSKTLKQDEDYTVTYYSNINKSSYARAYVQGKGNFTSSVNKYFSIVAPPVALTEDNVTISSASYVYDGTEKTPAVTVRYNGLTLTKGTDYTVSYKNNINAGTATVTVTGIEKYKGEVSKTFTISQKALSADSAALSSSSFVYDGTAKTPTVTVKDGSKTLTKDTDYTLSFKNNVNAGTATATVTGKGNYTGTVSKSFTITAQSLSAAQVTLSKSSYEYDGTAKEPVPTVKLGTKALTAGTDYTVTYSGNTNAGTAAVKITGKGNYTGTASATFTITAQSLSAAQVTLSKSSYEYDGTAKEPVPTVKLGTKTLTKDTDYTVAYSANTNAGTAAVKITGKGNYAGTASASFTITAKALTADSITLSSSVFVYDGKAKTPTVTVKDGSKVLTEGTDYTLSFKNNTEIGTATVTVTGKGNYKGAPVKTFTIRDPVIIGDVNGDGDVNMKDLTALQRYINGWDVEIIEKAADLNGDGSISMKDLTALQRLINGWTA